MIQALDPYGLVARARAKGTPENLIKSLLAFQGGGFRYPDLSSIIGGPARPIGQEEMNNLLGMGVATKNTPGDMPGTMGGINMPPVTPIEDIMKLLEPTSMASMASPEAAVPMPSYEVPSWLSGMEPNTRQQLMYGYTSPMYGGYDKILEYGRTPGMGLGMGLGMGYGKTPGNVCPYCGKSY